MTEPCHPAPRRRLSRLAFLACTALTVAGCNTVQGVGRDIQAGGRAITGAGATTSQAIGRTTTAQPAAEPTSVQPERRPETAGAAGGS